MGKNNNKKLNRLNLIKSGESFIGRKDIFRNLKSKLQSDSTLIEKPDIDREESQALVSYKGINDGSFRLETTSMASMAEALEETARSFAEMLNREVQEMNRLMLRPTNEWKETSVQKRINAIGMIVQSFNQVFSMHRIQQGKNLGRIEHKHSWESMTEKELEEKVDEIDMLLGRGLEVKKRKVMLEETTILKKEA